MNNIDPRSLAIITCPTCKNDTFSSVFQLREIPALLSPNGKAGCIRLEGVACTSCGAVEAPWIEKEEKNDTNPFEI